MTVDLLREICLSMPFASEDIKYGSDLCFSIGKKIFCGTRIEGPFRTGIKCTESDFIELTEREGIIPMPRLSITYWIRIEKNTALTSKEWKHYIKKSYEIIFTGLTKKERAQLGLQ